MSILAEIKTELNQLGIAPKKSLGQNFLVNEGIYKKIIAAAEIQKGGMVIEVGPGLGTLTQFLLDADAEILAIEKDRQLAEYLKTKFAAEKHVKIIEDDILNFDPKRWMLNAKRFKVVGNIPYYLTSHLLKIIFEKWSRSPSDRGSSTKSGPQPELIVLMIQKEVAQRIVAEPPNMNLLAVSIQYYAKAEIAGTVSRGSFWPQPKVDSAIIKVAPKTEIPEAVETERFFRVLKAGFSGTRKQLINTLSGGLKLPREIVNSRLLSLGIATQRRAETLTLDEWQNIATTLLPR